MKSSTTQNELILDPLNLDFNAKEVLINLSTIINTRAKYTGIGSKNNAKHPDKSFLNTIENIAYRSIDITLDYNCTPLIGLSLAGEYGENARECFHKICKINKKYDADTCDNEYSKYLKNESEIVSMELFHLLTSFSWCEKLDTLINKRSNERAQNAFGDWG